MNFDFDGHSVDLELVSPEEYPASTTECARFFLGCVLLKIHITEHKKFLSAGAIIETEAYTCEDPASHSHRGRTVRNQAMFSQAGNLYVYRSYGIHHCANIVTNGTGNAVLIRSLFPLAGVTEMSRRRNAQSHSNLCRGPGNVCAAMGIDMNDNFQPLYLPELWAECLPKMRPATEEISEKPVFLGLFRPRDSLQEFTRELSDRNYVIKQSARIGISKNKEAPWRYFMDISGYISHSRAGRTVG